MLLAIYDKQLAEHDELISKARSLKSIHLAKQEALNWGISCVIAMIPGIILSSIEIGLLQVLGVTSDSFTLDLFWTDAIISALFIGSGTKPIHEIIEGIRKVRTGK